MTCIRFARGSFKQVLSKWAFIKLAVLLNVCSCCMRRRLKRHQLKKKTDDNGAEIDRMHQLFINAEKTFFNELDVLNLIKTVRLMKVFASSVMTRRQKLLLRFQRYSLLDSAPEFSAASSEELMFKDLHHKKPLVRLFALGKIQKHLMTYT